MPELPDEITENHDIEDAEIIEDASLPKLGETIIFKDKDRLYEPQENGRHEFPAIVTHVNFELGSINLTVFLRNGMDYIWGVNTGEWRRL